MRARAWKGRPSLGQLRRDFLEIMPFLNCPYGKDELGGVGEALQAKGTAFDRSWRVEGALH